MQKKKDYLPIISLILSSIVCLGAISVAFAWMVNADVMRNMQFQILQIDSTINFYRAKDDNYNGVPELLTTNGHELDTYEEKDTNAYRQYTTGYYEEKYDFKLIDNKYMLSADTTANTFTDIKVENVAPSRVFTFKAEIVNYSGSDVTLQCEYDAESVEYLDKFETRLGTIEADGTANWIGGGWQSFSSSGTVMATGLVIEAATGDNQLDLWLQIRMKATAQTPQNATVILPYFRTTLEIKTGEDANA